MPNNIFRLKLLRQVLFLFSPGEKFALAGLLVLNVSCSLLEVIGIGSVIPFILLLTNPDAVKNNRWLGLLYDWLAPSSYRHFMILLAILIIIFFVVKNIYIFGVFTCQQLLLKHKFIKMSDSLFATYIFSPYKFFFNRSTSELVRNIQSIQSITMGMITPMFNLLAETITVGTIMLFLLYIDPIKSIIIAIVMGGLVLGFLACLKRLTHKMGERRLKHSGELISSVVQSLSSIKETRILGTEKFFQQKVGANTREIGSLAVGADTISACPRFYIEIIATATVLSIMIILLSIGRAEQTILLELSVLGMAAIRLMPSVTRISVAIGNIRIYIPAFNEVYDDIIASSTHCAAKELPVSAEQIEFKDSIEMRNVFFSYASGREILSNVSLSIRKNQWIGIVGHSGSGKTTIIDLLMGLLDPDSGEILVDGRHINACLRGWQNKIGYIPQRIFIFNDTIRNNIALGIPPEDIDDHKIMRVAEIAQLSRLLQNMPDGLDTLVGENGIKLSGGEKQRLGIARALYRNPEVLIMDEATAALDNETEYNFMESMRLISCEKTIISIAHRLTTIQHCDMIFFMENGSIAGSGSYHDLRENNPLFRALIQKGQA